MDCGANVAQQEKSGCRAETGTAGRPGYPRRFYLLGFGAEQ
jgi:hypothetical protein